MSDRIFYVGAHAQDDNKKLTGYVGAKFLTINGQLVMDPTPGGSQDAYIYADGSDRYKTKGSIANPSNYLIVPANYTEQQARAFADDIANTMGQAYPGDETGAAGLNQALGQMAGAFLPNRSQDLQRHPQWGIPKDSVVPAFVSSASYHLGSVTRQAGLPKVLAEIGGGTANRFNAHVKQNLRVLFGYEPDPIDTTGDIWGLSKQNYANLSKGFSDAGAASSAPSPINSFGYGPQAQYPAGQIGDGNGLGVGDWRFSLADVDPRNPTRPAPPPQIGGTPGIINGKPVPHLSRRNGNNSPASVFESSAPAARFVLPDNPKSTSGLTDWIAALAGIDPQDPTQPAPSPQADQLRGFYRDDPMQPWFVQGRS